MTNEGIEGIAVLNIPTLRVEVREVSRREGKSRGHQKRVGHCEGDRLCKSVVDESAIQ